MPTPVPRPRRKASPATKDVLPAEPSPLNTPGVPIGVFRSIRISRSLPEPLATWCVATDRWRVAESTAQLLGGTIRSTPPTDGAFEILTATAEVDIIIDAPSDIRTEMKLWDRTGLAHHCDGQFPLGTSEEHRGTSCGCPASFAERRARARAGRGPQAYTATRFRLTALPDLGAFVHQSLSWELAEEVDRLRASAAEAHGPAHFKLRLAEVEFAGTSVQKLCYRRPFLDFVAPVASALARGGTACQQTVADAARAVSTVVQAILAPARRASLRAA